MRIDELIIEPGCEKHIARHQVTLEEVDEVVFGRPFVSRAREGRLRLIGQTEAGRYLTILLGHRVGGRYGLITARDATHAERRIYQRRRRR